MGAFRAFHSAGPERQGDGLTDQDQDRAKELEARMLAGGGGGGGGPPTPARDSQGLVSGRLFPFDTGCSPLSYSGNPGVKCRISQGNLLLSGGR